MKELKNFRAFLNEANPNKTVLAEGHSLSDSDIDYLEDFINRSSNEDNVILRRIIKNIIKTNIKPVKEQKTITEFVGKELEDRNEPLYDKLVPGQGDAETIEGEMLRAINRIVYRFYNDGDKYFEGYGTETAGPAHSFLVNANHPLKSAMVKLFDEPSGDNSYERMLKDVLDMILDYIESRQGKYTKNTLGGMFNYEPEFEEEEEDDDDYDYYDDEDDY